MTASGTYAEATFAPGSAYTLRCCPVAGATTVTDANGVALDQATASASAGMTSADGSTPLAAGTTVPYSGSNAWSLVLPGDDFVSSAVLTLTAALNDTAGTTNRLPAAFVLRIAPPDVDLLYAPGTAYPLSLSAITVPSGWTGIVTTVDRGGAGSQVDTGSVIATSGTSGYYELPQGVMVAEGTLLTTIQLYDSGGRKAWAYRLLLRAQW